LNIGVDDGMVDSIDQERQQAASSMCFYTEVPWLGGHIHAISQVNALLLYPNATSVRVVEKEQGG